MPETYADIWKTLSNVDVSAHVEKKGKLSYLSWAWAWGTLMEHYPAAEFHFPVTSYEGENATATVWCEVSIGGLERTMWLPVMDNRNKAIPAPTSRDISDARMRCLVKCLALFGLGFGLYAGEDMPRESEPAAAPAPAPKHGLSQMSSDNKDKIRTAAMERAKELDDESINAMDIIKAVTRKLGYASHIELSDGDFVNAFGFIQVWEPGE